MMYDRNLYKNFLLPKCSNALELNVISGFSSSRFLEEILGQFSGLKIKLYIGMALFGISKSDHVEYLRLQKSYTNLEVYYQVEKPETHMKIYSFKTLKGVNNYLGSANFSENGFKNLRECLCLVDEDFEDIFEGQRKISMRCDDPRVLDTIPFTEEIINERIENELNESEAKPNGDLAETSEDFITDRVYPGYLFKKNRRRKNRSIGYVVDLQIPILRAVKSDIQNKTGINSQFGDSPEENGIRQSNQYFYYNFFSKDRNICFETDDGFVLNAIRRGNKLFFKDNIYAYIAMRLGYTKKQPITEQALEAYGRTYLGISKIDQDTFYLDFRVIDN